MEQLLLVTSCDSPAGIGASLRTHGRTTDTGWTHRRDVGNSILDEIRKKNVFIFMQENYFQKEDQADFILHQKLNHENG